jgi:death-on-curing protein
MSLEPRWLSQEMVEALHALVLAQHGGGRGVRDARRLVSALDRPRNLHAYGDATPARMAAAYASGIIEGHPFVDGNKRTGLALAIAFLEFNGLRFRGSEVEAVVHTLGLAAGQIDEAAFAAWLEANLDEPRVEEPAPRRRKAAARRRAVRR